MSLTSTMSSADPGVIITDWSIHDAISHLRRAGFHVETMRRTICAYKGQRCYGFPARHGRFSREAITRAITETAT